jgi:hypothetical protein
LQLQDENPKSRFSALVGGMKVHAERTQFLGFFDKFVKKDTKRLAVNDRTWLQKKEERNQSIGDSINYVLLPFH